MIYKSNRFNVAWNIRHVDAPAARSNQPRSSKVLIKKKKHESWKLGRFRLKNIRKFFRTKSV